MATTSVRWNKPLSTRRSNPSSSYNRDYNSNMAAGTSLPLVCNSFNRQDIESVQPMIGDYKRTPSLNGNQLTSIPPINACTQCGSQSERSSVRGPMNGYYQQLLAMKERRNQLRLERAASFGDRFNQLTEEDQDQLLSFVTHRGPALYRIGSKGASWRHVAMTTSAFGGNVMFIDGEVKQCDSRFFPSWKRTKIQY